MGKKAWHFVEDIQVVGGYYHTMAEAMARKEIHRGSVLVLRREPFNVHDPFAIAVDSPQGTMLGYLPRHRAEYYGPYLDLDGKLKLIMVSHNDLPQRINTKLYKWGRK